VRVMLFDTETTGLIDNAARPLDHQPHMIEFFGISAVQEGKTIEKVGEWESLFHYAKSLPPKITQITGIRDGDLYGAPKFREKAEELMAFILRHDRVVAHNLSFDIGIVSNEYRRLGVEFEFPKDRMCTVEATEHLAGHRLSLTLLHERLFGEKFANAHRGRSDVEAMFRCYAKLLEIGEI
jgi:DNA polymerase III epsilon subunit-like protein